LKRTHFTVVWEIRHVGLYMVSRVDMGKCDMKKLVGDVISVLTEAMNIDKQSRSKDIRDSFIGNEISVRWN
jgi:hypothetical protein